LFARALVFWLFCEQKKTVWKPRNIFNQSIKGPHKHKTTHGQGEAASQHNHRGQQTLRHKVPQVQAYSPRNIFFLAELSVFNPRKCMCM